MFKVGDAVIHPAEGVCEIIDIAEKSFGGKTDEYYVLKSVYDGQSTVYIPVESVRVNPKIRPALDKGQVELIIDSLENKEPLSTENDNQRRLLFKNIMASGNPDDMGQMLKTVHLLKNSIRVSGKKIKVSDERIIKETERSVFAEFAFSLGISPDEIPSYMESRLGGYN